MHVFFAERDTRKVPGLAANAGSRAIASGAVVGAGTMGGGIAVCFANANLPVTILDSSQAALDRGLKAIGGTYDSMVRRGRLTPAEKERRMALIRGTLDYNDLSHADVLIEAVFEDLDLKRRIFRTLDEVAKPGAVLATNTSTLDIDEIASATRRPQDVLGLHFFAPANVMPLLEVVRTDRTDASVISTALDLAKTLRKTPVLARVCYGFIGNRMMEGYAREAQRMVLEGATPAPGRWRARSLGHGNGNPRGVRHGGDRCWRERAPGERRTIPARSHLLSSGLCATRRRPSRPEERKGLLPISAR